MSKQFYVVKYSGPFGFIKPWTAVRDTETFSQQFLTPSIVEGIEKKLFPELIRETGIHKIIAHRVNYAKMDIQQERTWAKGGFAFSKEKAVYKTNLGVLNRGVMIEPNLYLAFGSEADAQGAYMQTLCFCRNEDLLHPVELIAMSKEDFEKIPGFELIFTQGSGFKVGYNRYDNANEMFGELKIVGNPIRSYEPAD